MVDAASIDASLRKLFNSYSTTTPGLKQQYIRLPRFIQLARDAQLLDDVVDVHRVELVFCSANRHRHNMSLEVFLSSLPRLAELKYKTEFMTNPNQAFATLLQNHILPLVDTEDNQQVDSVDEESSLVLLAVYPEMKAIYSHYFPWETSHTESLQDIKGSSSQALFTLLADFDVCPALIKKKEIVAIMREAIESACETVRVEADLGSVFTLHRLLLVLYWCAQIGYSGDSQLANSKASEKLLVMLERMELSRGFQTYYRRKPSRGSLMPQKDVLDHVLQTPEVQSLHESEPLNLDENGAAALEVNIDRLKELFQSFCSYGEPMNTTKLKSSKLLKLFKDSGVEVDGMGKGGIKLTTADIDIVCAKLASCHARSPPKKAGFSSHNYLSKPAAGDKRLDFSQFLKAIELIAIKLRPDIQVEEAVLALVDTLLQQDVPRTSRGSQSELATQLMEMLKDAETVQALSLVHRSVVFYYRHYSDTRGFLNFSSFIKFCRDFSVFPDVVPKSRLQRIFFTLAGIHSETEQPEASRSSLSSRAPEQTEDDVVDEHLFVEGLALVAAEVRYRQPKSSIVERLCCLMERMSQSSGPQKVLLAEGKGSNSESNDLLTPLRQVFPRFFAHSAGRSRPNYQELVSSLKF
jgi:hypothetical protein